MGLKYLLSPSLWYLRLAKLRLQPHRYDPQIRMMIFETISLRLGYSSGYISSLLNEKATPAFKLWNQLKSISISPKIEMEQLDPNFDIIGNNMLLRA